MPAKHPASAPLARRQLLHRTAVSLPDLLAGDVVAAAAGLLGCQLVRTWPDGHVIRATLVETEAYHMSEPGSHAYRGKTPRNAVMFGPPGKLYVYFTYGMWYCANIVCEGEGSAAAVLLRAAYWERGSSDPHSSDSALSLEEDAALKSRAPMRLSGPGLLCQGLELTREHNGLDVLEPASQLRLERPVDWQLPPVEWTRRVGFSFECQLPWRAVWRGHPAVSPGRPGVVLKRKRHS